MLEKLKIVEQIGRLKKRKFNNMDKDDEGIDVDTFEANYVPEYEEEEEGKKESRRGGN